MAIDQCQYKEGFRDFNGDGTIDKSEEAKGKFPLPNACDLKIYVGELVRH